MYSYEERIRAVKLYIKLGKRFRATIRQLGYPTKNLLLGWYRQYERDRDLQVDYSAPWGNTQPNRCKWQFSITLTMIVALPPP